MAENIVVKEQLTAEMIDVGAALTQKLDELGVPITVALWLFDPESNEWHFVISSPDVSTKGPFEIYDKIHLATQQLGEKAAAVLFLSVRVLHERTVLVQAIRKAIHTGPTVSRVRLKRDVANGHYIEDALIYRSN